MQYVKLNDGLSMPQLGFGLWQVSDDETEKYTLEAIKAGYRSIDSAQIYQNEAGLGRAIKKTDVSRKDLYITTKIWNSEQGFDTTLKSFETSLKKLQGDYVDLLLIHWPAPSKNLYVETWKALIQIQKEGKAKSIGVSNFMPEHLERIIQETSVVPTVNQIELHPHFQQLESRSFHDKHNIRTESWSPLGQGKVLNDPEIQRIASRHNKSVAQIILRWHIENGLVAIPKSVTSSRIKENFDVFNFKLSADDLSIMAKLDDKNGRIGPNPMTAQF